MESLATIAAQATRSGIPESIFWEMTPPEVSRVVREWNKERMSFEKMADGRAAALMALIANVNRGKGTPSFKPQDFLPDYDNEEAEELTDAEKLTILMKIHGSN